MFIIQIQSVIYCQKSSEQINYYHSTSSTCKNGYTAITEDYDTDYFSFLGETTKSVDFQLYAVDCNLLFGREDFEKDVETIPFYTPELKFTI